MVFGGVKLFILSWVLGIVAIVGYLTVFLVPMVELIIAFGGVFLGVYLYNQSNNKSRKILSGIGSTISIVALLLTTIGYVVTLYSNIGL